MVLDFDPLSVLLSMSLGPWSLGVQIYGVAFCIWWRPLWVTCFNRNAP